jgi:hypothetical protein
VGPLYNTEAPPSGRASRWAGFAPSSPLFLAATALFIGGYAVWRFDPSVGPGSFPLWDLLVVLGFVSTIGAVLSWFFASGDGGRTEAVPAPEPVSSERAPARARARSPASSPVSRNDLGRPPPAVTPAPRPASPASGFSAALATTPRHAPVYEEPEDEYDARPLPLPTPPVEPIPRTEVEQMLRELDGIARDVGRRRPPTPASSY